MLGQKPQALPLTILNFQTELFTVKIEMISTLFEMGIQAIKLMEIQILEFQSSDE